MGGKEEGVQYVNKGRMGKAPNNLGSHVRAESCLERMLTL